MTSVLQTAPGMTSRERGVWIGRAQARRRRMRRRLRQQRIRFTAEMHRRHRQLRQSVPAFLWHGSVASLCTAPVVYSLGVPLALLDLWITLYQWVCFPIYGIARVRRRPYFVFDRHALGYLNAIEKAHCAYCSYATGVLAYVNEVAARTEQYWCPIKHADRIATPHTHYQQFFDFGDAEGYRQQLTGMRAALRHQSPTTGPRRRRRPVPEHGKQNRGSMA